MAGNKEIFTVREKNKQLKENDIIEVSMSIDLLIPEDEDFEKTGYVIDPNKYDTKYEVNYFYPNKTGSATVNYTDEAGCCSYVDIKDYLEDCIKTDIDEIEDYELFDIDDKSGEYQRAKIKVLKTKE